MNKEITCSQCGEDKELATEFYNNRSAKYGKDTICKACRKERQQEYLSKNPDYNKDYYYRVTKPRRKAEQAARKAAK